jgi:sugar-specific transcriptional regulator TrmB
MSSPDHLVALGFTGLESEAYCALLEEGPGTAYRVAQRLGKPVANLYQTMAALVRRGAVEFDDDGPRTYRAIDPDSLLGRLDRDYQERRSAAASELARLRRAETDDRVYQISDYGQALEHARKLIRDAREILIFDMFPDILAELAPSLDDAAERGVLTAGQVYRDVPLVRAVTARSALPPDLLARWPGQQLSVIADAARSLTALLDCQRRNVIRAFATDSAYLACLQHSGLCAEIRLTAMLRDGPDELAPISLLASYPEGLRTLVGPNTATEASSQEVDNR